VAQNVKTVLSGQRNEALFSFWPTENL
jgi:hypothetical protein